MEPTNNLKKAVLRVVRVLIFVDEDVAEGLLPALASFRKPLEHLYGQKEKVVEIKRIGGSKAPLIKVVDVGDGLLVERREAPPVLLGTDEQVLGLRDLVMDTPRREPLWVSIEFLEARLCQPDLVGGVVDREVGLVAEPRNLAAKNPTARGVEGHHPHPSCDIAE